MATSTPPDTAGDAATGASATKPEPITVAFTVGNTYRRLSQSEASYDKLTGRHLKVHDWTLYVDVLPCQDPDIIDRVTFDMRDDSFATTAFTCHCPIRIQKNSGSSFTGRISGGDNQNKSQKQIGQSTKEEPKPEQSSNFGSVATRPHKNQSRWRFSTRQQTFGPVNVQINIRGRGGCRCTVPYKVVLNQGGYECPADSLPLFVEKRPHQLLKPLKMMESSFSLDLYFGLDGSIATSSSLYETAKSVYSRSKIPIRLLLKSGEAEEFLNKPSASSTPWLVKLVRSASNASHNKSTDPTTTNTLSMSSPNLTGGHGLNECYKIIEGLPPSLKPYGATSPALPTTSIHVQIDVSKLSVQQITKVAMNFIKYEESMDSFMPWHRREDRCEDCRSNKQAMEEYTNKQRNQRISKCETLEELASCLNPTDAHYYKLSLRRFVGKDNDRQDESPSPKMSIQFRQHPSSKDKTTVTHWIRFCNAFVQNSARLRPPMALKATTSIEEEFDLLFEYVVKDRALRNYYKERRDTVIAEEEKERNDQLLSEMAKKSFSELKSCESSDSMSISGGSVEGSNQHLPEVRKRKDSPDQLKCRKRPCS